MGNKYACTLCIALQGIKGQLVSVETDINKGLPKFTIVGLPDISLKEAKYRVSSAINYSNLGVKAANITVNLSPASIYKSGSAFDLAIAMSILGASDKVDKTKIKDWIFIAELGLDGRLYPVNGILPMVNAAVNSGYKNIVVDWFSYAEAKLVTDANVICAQSLVEVMNFFGANIEKINYEQKHSNIRETKTETCGNYVDMADIKGNSIAKFGLEVAAVGGHNLFMLGCAGTGKTMLAKSLPTILPKLSQQEAIETTSIYSVAGKYDQYNNLIDIPPFCAPHHSCTMQSLVGGGSACRPGQISLAHNGVLFIDEAGEFSAKVLDSIRQPIEEGMVSINRVNKTAVYPAKVQLVMASNPCPCGFLGSNVNPCTCTPYLAKKYLSKLSGPLLDRIDIQLRVEQSVLNEFAFEQESESSQTVAQRVLNARKILNTKFKGTNFTLARDITPKYLHSHTAKVEENAYKLVELQISKGKLSMRGANKVLKVAISIAALDSRDNVSMDDVFQALALRMNIVA